MNFVKKNGIGIIVCAVVAGISTLLAGLNIGGFSFEVIGAPEIGRASCRERV